MSGHRQPGGHLGRFPTISRVDVLEIDVVEPLLPGVRPRAPF